MDAGEFIEKLVPGSSTPALYDTGTVTMANGGGVTFTVGQPVYISGEDMVNLGANTALNSSRVLGLVNDSSITIGSSGNIRTTGIVAATDAQWDLITPVSDISTVGSIIHSGTEVGGYEPAKAFDGNNATAWSSSEQGLGISTVSYIGRNFGGVYTVKQIAYRTWSVANNNISSWKVQVSNNGSSWTNVQTFTNCATGASTLVTLSISTPVAGYYIRMLANANLTGTYSVVIPEINFTASGLFAGNAYYLGATAGTITNIAPTSGYLTRIGKALSNTRIMLDIEDPIAL